ncbi:hypothetical protein ES703_51083 [subsurface metagenome]
MALDSNVHKVITCGPIFCKVVSGYGTKNAGEGKPDS